MEATDIPLPAGLADLAFDNAFVRQLPGDPSDAAGTRQVHGALWSAVSPEPVSAPRLLAYSPDVAGLLGLGDADLRSAAFVQVFAGNALLPGMQPYAGNYGGHQFGHWAGQLGDGRAITLGEVATPAHGRQELQLKGAGRTPYSRTADGRAVLRSSLREYLCSEAMHHLGVPTTRALSLVATGDDVLRDMFYDGHPAYEPGAVVCRVAPSFIRFGHFELPASRGDTALLERLVRFCIARDFPQFHDAGPAAWGDWFGEVCARTAHLVAEWQRVGFVHGVLNTDNMSILGLTIDYGPYGWMGPFDPGFTPNTTDREGRRYRYGWQPRVAAWNLSRLAGALSPLIDANVLQAGLDGYGRALVEALRGNAARKLGLRDADAAALQMLEAFESLMQRARLDMTLGWRALSTPDATSVPARELFAEAAYDAALLDAEAAALDDWLRALGRQVRSEAMDADARIARMRAANPLYLPRNHLAHEAIEAATRGDMGVLGRLMQVLRMPYTEQPGAGGLAARPPDWAFDTPGCSTLSCSS